MKRTLILYFLLVTLVIVGLIAMYPSRGFTIAVCLVIILCVLFFAALLNQVYPSTKKRFFYNRTGKFEVFDIVYDRGSATRPNMPGFLKHDGESWFLIYEDGFEWPLSDFRNIELFIYQPDGGH